MADPKLTPEKELALRQQLKTDIETVPATGAVFIKPEYFTSEQDFLDAVGKEVVAGEDLEVRFCQISFLSFEDNDQDGCEDNPAVSVRYKIHFFHQYVSERSDGSNSHDDFVAMLLNLRNNFLQTIEIDANTEREALKQDGFMITDDESEFFKGAFGHWINLIAKINLD